MTGNAIHGGRVSICGQRARCPDPRQKAKKPQFIIIDIDQGEVALPLQSARHEEGQGGGVVAKKSHGSDFITAVSDIIVAASLSRNLNHAPGKVLQGS